MFGSVQWTEITSLVDYTICGPQIKLVLDGPCWSVAAENLKKIPKNTNGRLAIPAPAGLLVLQFFSHVSSNGHEPLTAGVLWHYCSTFTFVKV